MKKAIVSIIILAALGGGGYAYYKYSQKPPDPEVLTAVVTRGDIVDTVGSTGQLSAVRTVPVGSQVGGKVLALYADFNSMVREGQLLAEIDPETIKTQILNAKANLIRAQTDVERAKVTLADAQRKWERSKELSAKNLVPKTDLDAAELSLFSAQSGVKTSEAALQQAEASLSTQDLNLTYTKIYSPIDGVVISRAVDVGQTVSVSTQAPTIFNLATELTTMKVLAGIDETDVGRIRPQQHATFRVDAYPNKVFTGTVEQVRLEARMQQNVVTYQTVISVPNPDLELKPGMTANINIEILRRDDVLRVPAPALRFRPTNDMYVALGLEPPPADAGRGGRGGGRGGPGGPGAPGAGAPGAPPARGGENGNGEGSTAAPARGPGGQRPAAGAPAPAASANAAGRQGTPEVRAEGRQGGGGQPGGRGGSMTPEQRAAMQNMTPEERAAMMARGGNRGGSGQGGRGGGGRGGDRTRGGNGGRGGTGAGRGGSGGGRGPAGAPGATQPTELTADELNARRGLGTANSIDLLFPALASAETRGRAWVWNKEKKELKVLNLRLGITDGQNTELIEGDLHEGDAVVSNIIIPQAVRPAPGSPQNNPFFQNQRGGPGGRGPGGGPPGGGGGGGGNRGGGGGGGGRGF